MESDKKLLERYEEKGWVAVDGVFSRDEAERIAELAHKYVAVTEDGEPRKVNAPFTSDPAFARFALDVRLRRLLSIFLKGKAPLLATDQIFMKPPRHGSAKPYHQDNAYFLCSPEDEVVTAWIALDDVDEGNGCLRYIDGSHRGGILPHTPVPGEGHNLAPDDALIDLSKESLAIVKKGGVVFHHGTVLHTSHRNHSDRWRRAYATHWVTADVTSESPVISRAYFNREGVYPDDARSLPSQAAAGS